MTKKLTALSVSFAISPDAIPRELYAISHTAEPLERHPAHWWRSGQAILKSNNAAQPKKTRNQRQPHRVAIFSWHFK